jgi:poly-gamma-glutamate capsule biosynthesis protein CapA/YwtB (metallophosphatase superfamily)
VAVRARSLRGLCFIACASVAAVVVGRSSRAQTAGNTAIPGPQRPASRAVTIAATGDVLVHRRVVAAAQTHASEGGFRWILSALGAQLPATDIGFVNLESPLTEAFRSPANATPPVLGAPTSYGADLAATGFDVLSVANNHAFDQAGDGLAITLDAIRSAGMVSVGAGRTEADARAPVVVVRDGVRVAFVATTERMNNGSSPNRAGVRVFMYDAAKVQQSLTAARAAADVVVLSIHWSHDFVRAPTAEQRRLARQLVAWGADVIVGTGPHILQEVERIPSPRGEAVCAYSLGNVVSNQGYRYRVGRALDDAALRSALDNPMTRDVVLLRVGAERVANNVRITTLEARAFWNENRSPNDELRLVPLRSVAAALRDERLAVMRRTLGAAVTVVP